MAMCRRDMCVRALSAIVQRPFALADLGIRNNAILDLLFFVLVTLMAIRPTAAI
jgi:hypothetical protein